MSNLTRLTGSYYKDFLDLNNEARKKIEESIFLTNEAADHFKNIYEDVTTSSLDSPTTGSQYGGSNKII